MEYRSRSTTRLPVHNDSPRREDDFLDRFDTGRHHRSRSLDLRGEQELEDEFETARNRFTSNAVLPYDRDRGDRGYRRADDFDDYRRGRRWEEKGWREGGDKYSPRSNAHSRTLARSQEWYPRRDAPSPRYRYDGERSRQNTSTLPPSNYSPRTATAGKQLRVNVNGREQQSGRGRTMLPSLEKRKDNNVSPRSGYSRDEFGRGDRVERGERRYEGEWSGASAGGGGGRSHSHHHSSSYHHERSGGASVGNSGVVRRSPLIASTSNKGYDAYGRPQPYRKIRICCMTFTWPPWSYETVEPPQPIYRNPNVPAYQSRF